MKSFDACYCQENSYLYNSTQGSINLAGAEINRNKTRKIESTTFDGHDIWKIYQQRQIGW